MKFFFIYSWPVFRIRIRFIRILDFFPFRIRIQANKKQFFQRQKQNFWEKFLFSTQKVGILFLFSTNQVGILLNRELLFGTGIR